MLLKEKNKLITVKCLQIIVGITVLYLWLCNPLGKEYLYYNLSSTSLLFFSFYVCYVSFILRKYKIIREIFILISFLFWAGYYVCVSPDNKIFLGILFITILIIVPGCVFVWKKLKSNKIIASTLMSESNNERI
jgi:hypothetical protein